MKEDVLSAAGLDIPLYSMNTLIIGSGAASLNAAVQLFQRGQRNIAVATDNWGGGTSNNAGSDKQTYYKLSLAGKTPDSALDMAEDLYRGGCMHGDIALCEALNSARAFFHLVDLGVPFPRDGFGAFVGYKTDHDPRQRGTSAGPLTSNAMFQCLADDIREKGIPVFDRHEIISLLTEKVEGEIRVFGAIALNLAQLDAPHFGLTVFNAVNVVLGTGGPAGIYAASVYPESQTGSHGLAFAAGVRGQNLTESQFGIASVKFRWNLSGTYQQVVPRYVSTDVEGKDEREFLNPFFPDMGTLATAIFLKGYQWPFDPRKVREYGSSLIDILVYRETAVLGRRVFLDFRRNPSGGGIFEDFSLDRLSEEALSYLEKSGAVQKTPIERLTQMNPPAIDLYREHGIDISRELLEVAVCAQHNNGGLKGNIWWESNVRHLFPVGEVNGTHGVYRPGGSALNSGQVGGLRAAEFISARYDTLPPDVEGFAVRAREKVGQMIQFIQGMYTQGKPAPLSVEKVRSEIQRRMSAWGAHIRDRRTIGTALEEARRMLRMLRTGSRVNSPAHIPSALKNLDLCLTHVLYLEAIDEYLEKGGKSRGSYLVLDPGGEAPCPQLGDEWRFVLDSPESFVSRKILEIGLDETGEVVKEWCDVRPIPREESWFENVWAAYRSGNIIE